MALIELLMVTIGDEIVAIIIHCNYAISMLVVIIVLISIAYDSSLLFMAGVLLEAALAVV